MVIVLHVEADEKGNVIGREVLHTERADWNRVRVSTNPDVWVDVVDFIMQASNDAAIREKAGYNQITHSHGEDKPRSKWDRIHEASAHPDADPVIKGKLSLEIPKGA